MNIKHATKWLTPCYDEYLELINNKLDVYARKLTAVDTLLEKNYSPVRVSKYSQQKCQIVHEALHYILSYFPQFQMVPCAIYLNGSYARVNITAGSDLDIIFLFDEDFLPQMQAAIMQVRLAIAKVFCVNVVHIHSFAKNFINEKINNQKILDIPASTTYISWPYENKDYEINNDGEYDLVKREICEYLSVRSWASFCNTMQYKIKNGCAEWLYSFSLVYKSVENYDIERFISNCEEKLRNSNQYNELTLDAIKKLELEVDVLLNYIRSFTSLSSFSLEEFSVYIRKKPRTMVSQLLVLLHRITSINGVDLGMLNIDRYFSYAQTLNNTELREGFSRLFDAFCQYRHVISRMEIMFAEENIRVSHRSREKITVEKWTQVYQVRWRSTDACFGMIATLINQMSKETLFICNVFLSLLSCKLSGRNNE